MSLEEIYRSKSDEELVIILESRTDYQDGVIKIVESEFKKRNIPPEFSNKLAKKVFKAKLKESVLGNALGDIDHEIPVSYFLTETQMKKIHKQLLAQRRALLESTKQGAINVD